MSDSTKAGRPRIVPAIPLSLAKPAKTKSVATPESSERSGPESRQEHVVLNGVHTSPVGTTPHHAPLTPESKSSTPANGERIEGASVISSSEGQNHHEHGQTGNADHILPATPVSNTGSHSSSQIYADSGAKGENEEPKLDVATEMHVPNGVPRFSPQRGTYRMPPPFYPSEKNSYDVAPVEDIIGEQPSDVGAKTHHPRPIASSIVFGGMPDSSSSSPVPFTPSGSAPYSVPVSHHSTFAGNVNAPPFYPAVAIPPFSEPQVSGGYTPATATATSFPPYNTSQAWVPPVGAFQYPVSAVLPIPFAQPISPSLSHQSSTRGGRERPISREKLSQQLKLQQEASEKTLAVEDGSESIRNSAIDLEPPHHDNADSTLESFLLSQFGKFDYADCVLESYLASDPDVPARFPAHRLLLARSPRLAAELATGSAMAEFDLHGLRVLRIWTPSRFATASAIAEALRYLYGAPLQEDFERGEGTASDADSVEASKRQLTEALSFVAAGSTLELSKFAHRALGIATSFVNWDTVEMALSFALDGAEILDLEASHHANVEPAREEDVPADQESAAKPPQSYEALLLAKVMAFLLNSIPIDFLLDTNAPQSSLFPRLPISLVSLRPSVSDPRLSRIQFGDIHSEIPSEEKHVGSILSTILLSLPFPQLASILEHQDLNLRLGKAKLADVMQSVVDERERRRLKALRGSRSSKHTRATEDPMLWENLYWEERSEDTRLVRSRKQDETSKPGSTV